MCRGEFLAVSAISITIFVVNIGIMFVRAYILCQYGRVMLLVMACIYFGGITYVVYTIGRYMASIISLDIRIFPSGCSLESDNSPAWTGFLTILCLDSCPTLLLIIKSVRSGWDLPKILRLMVNDSVMYYGCIFCLSLANVIVLLRAPNQLSMVMFLPHTALQSVLCSQLILHGRQVRAERESNELGMHLTTRESWRIYPSPIEDSVVSDHLWR